MQPRRRAKHISSLKRPRRSLQDAGQTLRAQDSRLPTSRDVSLIIPAFNEAARLRYTLPRMRQWPEIKEIIVIANGCTDNTARVAAHHGARVLEFPVRLGHDTGRAIGAKAATGDYLIFLDADIAWYHNDIRPFVRALRRGADVVLNRYPSPADKTYDHPTAVAKRVLNLALQHAEWKASSLTAVPNGMRRQALERIGVDSLAIPPLAFVKAVLAGLKVARPHYVNVGLRNRWTRRYEARSSISDQILGDHVQALSHLLSVLGPRGGFPDGTRQRQVLREHPSAGKVPKPLTDPFEVAPPTPVEPQTVSDVQGGSGAAAVIPARNERATLPLVVQQARKIGVAKIIVVENGSTDGTERMQWGNGVDVWHFKQPLGHDVGRAIAARSLQTHTGVLFVDADIRLSSRSLRPFLDSVRNGSTDVALNRLGKGIPMRRRRDAVSTMKTFLNIALRRPKLGVTSLTAVPHALSQRALQTIPCEELAVPPKAYVRAVLSGLTVKPVNYVDVIRGNRKRPQLHAGREHSQLSRLIIGDHLEALGLLVEQRGERGGFGQDRRLEVLGQVAPGM